MHLFILFITSATYYRHYYQNYQPPLTYGMYALIWLWYVCMYACMYYGMYV